MLNWPLGKQNPKSLRQWGFTALTKTCFRLVGQWPLSGSQCRCRSSATSLISLVTDFLYVKGGIPALAEEQFLNSQVMRDLEAFKAACDVILTNRMSPGLEDVADKLTRATYQERIEPISKILWPNLRGSNLLKKTHALIALKILDYIYIKALLNCLVCARMITLEENIRQKKTS